MNMSLGWRDFAQLFGVPSTYAPHAAEGPLRSDFGLRALSEAEEAEWVGKLFQRTRVPIAKPNWGAFWAEHRFGDEPKYLTRPGQPIRWNGNLWMPSSDRIEIDFLRVERAFLFDRFFNEPGHWFYEFGAGTGHNTKAFSEQFRDRSCVATDLHWMDVPSECPVRWSVFDMKKPPHPRAGPINADAHVFTSGSMEQLGRDWRSFLWYLIAMNPAVVLHVEPIEEMYDARDPLESMALAYHRHRGYLSGYLTALRELAKIGRIEILEERCVDFGSLTTNGYNWVAWRPS
jgi:hypothetical protein